MTRCKHPGPFNRTTPPTCARCGRPVGWRRNKTSAVSRTLPKEVTEAADRLSLLRALRTAARTMLTTTAMDWVRMGLPEAELAEVMEGLAQEFKAAARKKGVQG